jgi:integrase
MRGSTRKRGKTWTAYWDAQGQVEVETGAVSRVQKSKGGFRTQKDAQRFLQDTLPKVATGTYVEPSTEPLSAFMAGWLRTVEANGEVKDSTAHRYGKIIDTYVAPRDIGKMPLARLDPAAIIGLYADLERCSKPACTHTDPSACKGLSAATRQLIHAVLRRALNDAVRWEKLARNPASQVRGPRAADTRVQSLSAGELRRFLAHVEHDRLSALWRLAATTGMRRGELLGLQWIDVDLDAAKVSIERQLRPTVGGPTLGTPKSKRGTRTISLDAATVEALGEHRDRQLAEQSLAGDAYEHADFVFCNELGAPIWPERLTEAFSRHRKAAGLPVGSLHVLRHTAATLALTAGIPLHVVAARLGDKPEIVLQTYAHLLPHSDSQAADAIAAAIVDKPLTEPAGDTAQAL